MYKLHRINPVARAIATMGAVAALVTGVTFAVLTSNSVVLADSDFTTATASLKIWDPTLVTPAYVTTSPGFNFTDIIPGTPTSEFTFWLKNDGTAPLTVSTLGAIDSYTGFTDFSKVHFSVRNITAAPASPVVYDFDDLLDATPDTLPGNPLGVGAENQYGVTLTVDSDSLAGSSAHVENFDWTFTGTNP